MAHQRYAIPMAYRWRVIGGPLPVCAAWNVQHSLLSHFCIIVFCCCNRINCTKDETCAILHSFHIYCTCTSPGCTAVKNRACTYKQGWKENVFIYNTNTYKKLNSQKHIYTLLSIHVGTNKQIQANSLYHILLFYQRCNSWDRIFTSDLTRDVATRSVSAKWSPATRFMEMVLSFILYLCVFSPCFSLVLIKNVPKSSISVHQITINSWIYLMYGFSRVVVLFVTSKIDPLSYSVYLFIVKTPTTTCIRLCLCTTKKILGRLCRCAGFTELLLIVSTCMSIWTGLLFVSRADYQDI